MAVRAAALALMTTFATMAMAADPAVSSQCLSCHDGSSAPDVREHASHPTAIDYYDSRRGEMRLRAPALPSGFGGTIEADLLVDGRVECSSCHVDHSVATEKPFRLRMDGTVTQLCLACHVQAK